MSWVTIKGQREELASLQTKMRAIHDTAQTEKRDLTKTEDTDFTALATRAEVLVSSLQRLNAISGASSLTPAQLASLTREPVGGSQNRENIAYGLEKRFNDGFAPDGTHNPNDPPLSISKCLRGALMGDWAGASAEKRAMNEGSSSAGGVFIPSAVSGTVIDLARNMTVAFRLGAMTIPMEYNTLRIARITGDPAVGWKAENAAFPANDSSFDSVTLTTNTLGVVVKLSLELASDAPNVDQLIQTQLAKSLALELDRAIMFGSGASSQPTGISATSGIQTMTTVGTPTNYAPWSNAIQLIRQVNGEPNGIAYAPRTAGTLDRLVDSLGQPMRPTPSVDAIPKLASNQFPINLGGGTNESQSIVADWTKVLVGMRQQLFVEVSRESADSSSSAWVNGQVWIRAYMRADVKLAHANQFVLMSGILA